MQEQYGLTETDRVLQKTPFSFDVSVWEFFWPLMTGAALVMARPQGHKDTAYLVKVITEQQITTLHFVPSMLRAFLAQQSLAACTSLKRVICSGEALPYDLQEQFFSSSAAELHNLYGPTEAAIDVSYWACERENKNRRVVPIGRAIANTQLYVLDKYGQPVPIGVAGELYIGGAGVARGYWRRPDLTAAKFLPDPFANDAGARLYETGDSARYLPDGNLEFLGRLDQQVKIRGFRIELGEIEAALAQHPAVSQALVVTREETTGDKRLVAYLVKDGGQAPGSGELRSYLQQRLPDYMIPAHFILLDEMPLTANGKLNRRALPAVDSSRPELKGLYVAPRTPVEEVLAGIWREVLGVEKAGVHDNFFELGGHSLLATQVISRVRELLQAEVPLHLLFERPTVAGFADTLIENERAPGQVAATARLLKKIKNMSPAEKQSMLTGRGKSYG